MKRWISLLMAMLLMATCAQALGEDPAAAPTGTPVETQAEEGFPLAFAFDISWDDTQETLKARLGNDAYIVDEESMLVTTHYDGMAYVVSYKFTNGKLSSVIIFTDSVGGSEYRLTCADHYDKTIAAVEAILGADTPVKVKDAWKSPVYKSLYEGVENLSVPMWEGYLTRMSIYYAENATVSVAFLLSGDSLTNGIVINPPEAYTGVWSEKAYGDGVDTYIVSEGASGTSAALGTGTIPLEAVIECHTYGNTNGLFIDFTLMSNEITSGYSTSGTEVAYDVVLVDGAGVTHRFSGVMKAKQNWVRIEGAAAEEAAAALSKGGSVTVTLRGNKSPFATHTFTLENADGFSTVFTPWRAAHPSYGIWSLKTYTDADRQYIVSDAVRGWFNNSATTGSKLKAYVFCQDFSDTHENFVVIRMFEYETYQVENIFSDTDYYTITVTDKDGVKHRVSGYISGKSKDIMVTGSDARTIINALRKGGQVQFFIQHNDYSYTMYSFTITNADGFDAIFNDWK